MTGKVWSSILHGCSNLLFHRDDVSPVAVEGLLTASCCSGSQPAWTASSRPWPGTSLPGEDVAAVAREVRPAVVWTLDALAEAEQLTPAQLAILEREGREAAIAGESLQRLLDRYLSTGWVVWEAATGEEVQAPLLAGLGTALLKAGDSAAAAIAQGYGTAQRELALRAAAARREFVDEVLDLPAGDVEAAARLRRRAEAFGLEPAGTYRVVVVSIDAEPVNPDLDLDVVARAIEGVAARGCPRAAAGRRGGRASDRIAPWAARHAPPREAGPGHPRGSAGERRYLFGLECRGHARSARSRTVAGRGRAAGQRAGSRRGGVRRHRRIGRGGAAPGTARARRCQRGSPGAGPAGRRFPARSCRWTRARANPPGAPQRRRPAGDHRTPSWRPPATSARRRGHSASPLGRSVTGSPGSNRSSGNGWPGHVSFGSRPPPSATGSSGPSAVVPALPAEASPLRVRRAPQNSQSAVGPVPASASR